MSGSDFDKDLAARIAAANAKRGEYAEAEQATEADRREQQRQQAERLVAAKNRASGFRSKHLVPLLNDAQRKAREVTPEFCFTGDHEESDSSFSQLIRAGDAKITASVSYSADKLTVHMSVNTPKKGCCYSECADFQAEPFDEPAAAEWVKPRVVDAIGLLVASGEIPTGHIVRYGKYPT